MQDKKRLNTTSMVAKIPHQGEPKIQKKAVLLHSISLTGP